MIEKIEDVRNAIKNKTYYCALALALTLPDICSQVERELPDNQNSNRTMYIDWVKNHIDKDDFQFPLEGFDIQTFSGEMCYSLRCKVLHNGNTNVKNKQLGVIVDDFELTFPSEGNYYHGYKYFENPQPDGTYETITCIGIDYLCERLCDTAEEFYDEWENKDDFRKHSF